MDGFDDILRRGFGMSERQQLALRLSAICAKHDMTTPYGGYTGQHEERKGKPHLVMFCRPRDLDGTIEVYSLKFIRVSLKCRYLSFPHKWNAVFESADHVAEFLELFGEGKYEKAQEIPKRDGNASVPARQND